MATETKKSNEDIQREILEVDLQTKKLQLGQARQQNADFEAREKRRHDLNKQRMGEMAEGRRNRAAMVKMCRHKSGGTPANVLRGGGIGSFSIISRAVLPDGVTIVLQCPRCRMVKYPPSEQLKHDDAKAYQEELQEYNRLLEISREQGLEHAETRGPTFFFQKDGVPIVPDRL
jgi:hypothetical protein